MPSDELPDLEDVLGPEGVDFSSLEAGGQDPEAVAEEAIDAIDRIQGSIRTHFRYMVRFLRVYSRQAGDPELVDEIDKLVPALQDAATSVPIMAALARVGIRSIMERSIEEDES